MSLHGSIPRTVTVPSPGDPAMLPLMLLEDDPTTETRGVPGCCRKVHWCGGALSSSSVQNLGGALPLKMAQVQPLYSHSGEYHAGYCCQMNKSIARPAFLWLTSSILTDKSSLWEWLEQGGKSKTKDTWNCQWRGHLPMGVACVSVLVTLHAMNLHMTCLSIHEV